MNFIESKGPQRRIDIAHFIKLINDTTIQLGTFRGYYCFAFYGCKPYFPMPRDSRCPVCTEDD